VTLASAPVAAQAQAVTRDLPLTPGTDVAALTDLKTILTTMGGQLVSDAPQAGQIMAMFPGSDFIQGLAWDDRQGKAGITLTCTGESRTVAEERCATVERQYKQRR
jgi:hypothetical protein